MNGVPFPVGPCVLALVVIAAIYDIHARRIPNWLVVIGLGAGLVVQCALHGAIDGMQLWGGGLLVGGAVLLPGYLLRMMGAGDVKLMAAVGCFCGASGAFDAALKYSKRRKQFGRFISEFQAIQDKLAGMATDIEAARWLVYSAGARKDAGKRVTKESAMAKLFASEMAVKVADQALQIHGGYGFIKDYPVEKFYRDVKLCTIGEGTSEIQRLVIARQLLKE